MFIQAEFGQRAASNQQASAIGGGPVGETVLDPVPFQFVRVGGAENLVAGDFRGHNLDHDIAVGKTNDEAVLGGIVFVLGLGDQAFAGIVVGFTLTTTFIFGLEAAAGIGQSFGPGAHDADRSLPVVCAVLDQLGERLG